jgi:predicted ATPase/DNA-binding winged helix-turn-helix (wHTH) protein
MSSRVQPARPELGIVTFGSFQLDPARKLLLDDDKPVRLGSRAFEVLLALVERAGETVSKDDLVARVWPDTFVGEVNLRVHVAAVRRALGDGLNGLRFIANEPGRGYRFVAPVSIIEEPTQVAHSEVSGAGIQVAPSTRVIGRDHVVTSVTALVQERRLVNIVGPGGIGKTTVALAVCKSLYPKFGDRIKFVDLAPINDPKLVASTVAAAIGVGIRSDYPIPTIVSALKQSRILLVLDNCEHVIDAVAMLVEAVLEKTIHVRILATSREPLRAQGEQVVRLPALGVPEHTVTLTAKEALKYPAIQLFVERAAALLDAFELTDADAPEVGKICVTLDGIALAIELAAGRVDAFGVAGLADLLNDRFRILTRGRRTALPRHRTLAATLDWSYDLLTEGERRVFQCLGVFAGWFTSDAAAAVMRGFVSIKVDLIEALADLVAKSMVVADTAGATTYYRLLESTRAYAYRKLQDSGEVGQATEAHARYYRQIFEKAEEEWSTRPTADWLATYRRKIDNVRVALDWAFSPTGHPETGVALTIAAIPLWFELSLMEECRRRVECALAIQHSIQDDQGRRAMLLQGALVWSQMYTSAGTVDADSAWSAVLQMAEALDDADYQLRSLWGLWASRMNRGEFEAAVELAGSFCRVAAARGDGSDASIGERLSGAPRLFLGDLAGARHYIDRMLASYVNPPSRSHTVRFQFDQRVTARITLQRALWLQGYADQSLQDVHDNMANADALGHTLSLCNALAQAACPITLLCGELDSAERYTTLLLDRTSRDSLDVWHAYGQCFEGELLVRRGHAQTGLELLVSGLEKLRQAGFVQYLTAFLAVYAEILIDAGKMTEARAVIGEALHRLQRTDERWFTPELLRLQGVTTFEMDRRQEAEAEKLIRSSLDLARRQGALAWELRAAMSLCRLQLSQGTVRDGRELLALVLGRFSEGFGTADLVAAKTLIQKSA